MTIEELLKHEEYGKRARAYADRRVTDGVKAFELKHPPAAPELARRVQRLEKAAAAKIQAAETRAYLLEKAFEAGIKVASIDALGLVFKDRADVDGKLKTLSEQHHEAETAAANRLMVSGFKPGSGNTERPDPRKLSRQDAISLEETGSLNAVLGGRG
jgi:hypothetical protein